MTLCATSASNASEPLSMSDDGCKDTEITAESVKERLETILDRRHSTVEEAEKSMIELRSTLLTDPCSPELRGRIWKHLLRLCQVSAQCYIHLVHRGPSKMDVKIRNDTFRTLTTDAAFLERVSEDMLIRTLNAFVWISQRDELKDDTIEEHSLYRKLKSYTPLMNELTYVQGMNVLMAPFLMTMTEMEAFHAFSTFIWRRCPLYVKPTLQGVHCGLKLLDACLCEVDPTLYSHLLGKGLSAKMYAFASVLTFSACTPPLSELLRLWDVMLALGIHMNILYIIAQLSLVREELLQCPSPMKILRKLPPLQAQPIIAIALDYCKSLSHTRYDQLVRHAYDESVAVALGVQVAEGSAPNDESAT